MEDTLPQFAKRTAILLTSVTLAACASREAAGPTEPVFPSNDHQVVQPPNRGPVSTDAIPFQRLSENAGLEVASMNGGEYYILRLDPKLAPLTLINQKDPVLSFNDLVQQLNPLVAVNAPQFDKVSGRRSIGVMCNHGDCSFGHRNRGKFWTGWFVFDPLSSNLPPVDVVATAPLSLGNPPHVTKYNGVLQTILLWRENAGIQWDLDQDPNNRKYFDRMAFLGVDNQHRVILIFHPGFIEAYDLISTVTSLPLNLKALLYLDGGTHGSLVMPQDGGPSFPSGRQVPNILAVMPEKK